MRAQQLIATIGGAAKHMRPDARWLPVLALGLCIAWWLTAFPVLHGALALIYLAAAAAVAWRPVLVFTILASALPVFDLAPWSGRRLVTEFDALIAVTIAVAWARLPARSPPQPRQRAVSWALAWLLAATAASAARAFLPFDADTHWDLGNPLAPFNALRIAKGSVWAWCLWRLARRLRADGADVGRAFAWGMSIGLVATATWIMGERLAFSHLLDFATDYRVAGPFSAMSLGGAYVECFLAVATPFVLALMVSPMTVRRVAFGCAVVAAASYAVMVTYSRGGYGALALGLAVFTAAAASARRFRAARLTTALAAAALAAAVAYPIATGSFARSRLQATAADLTTREKHWADSLRLMDSSDAALAFGIGLGGYARADLLHSEVAERAGGYRLVPDGDGGRALRLGAGYAFFVEQIVPVVPRARYRLQARYRAGPGVSPPAISLCQKWIVASFDCSSPEGGQQRPPQSQSATGGWHTLIAAIQAPAAGPGPLPRPVRLSLRNPGRAPLDLKGVSLIGPDGVDLVRNRSFAQGMDHWTFTSDNHLAWHAKSLPLGTLIEMGAFGLAALAAVLLLGVWTAARAAASGQVDGAAFLAALCAFAAVGSIDTLIDVPRFSMLLLLLCLLPGALRSPGDEAA